MTFVTDSDFRERVSLIEEIKSLYNEIFDA